MSALRGAGRAAALGLLLWAAAALSQSRAPLSPGAGPPGAGMPDDPHDLLAMSSVERHDAERGLPESARTRFMPEMEGVVRLLRGRVARPGTAGAVEEAVGRVRAFCRLCYRILGAAPGGLDPEMVRTGVGDASLLQARALNCIESLHVSAGKKGPGGAVAEASASFGACSASLLGEIRGALDAHARGGRGGRGARHGLYEPGRGFPSAWSGGDDCEGHWRFSGSEARYRVVTE